VTASIAPIMGAWLAAFVALLAVVLRAATLARRARGEVVPRGQVAAAALLVAALGGSAAWAWGAVHARGGIERIRAAGEQATGEGADAPARARLFLRATQLPVPEAGASVGYAPGAALRLPRGYGLDEAQRGWDLLDVTVRGPQGLAVAPRAPAPGTGEPTSTRIVLAIRPRPSGALPPLPDEVARLAASALDGKRCGAATTAPTALDGPGVLVAVLCRGTAPVAALAFDRDLGAGAALTSVRVTPLVWRGTSFRPHHVQIGSGALLQIGALADAVPGVTLWEVPAPVGRAELFFPPDDILAPCRTWIARRGPVLPVPGTQAAPAEATPGDRDSICVLPFQPPFALEVRRLLPDVAGVDARSGWAAGLLITPALLALLVLAARPRGELTRERFARALALGWVGSFVAALGVWRLLWAHRIDMLRDYEAIGSRVIANQTLLVLVAAALAGTAVLVIADRGGRRRALPIAAGAWLVTALAGGLALRGDVHAVLALRQLAAQALVSLAIATALGWGPLLAGALQRGGGRLWARAQPALGLADDDRATATAVGGLIAIAAAATVGDLALPRLVAGKLALAYLTVGAAYAALRAAIAVGPVRAHRIAAAILGLTAAAGALYRYDAGITAAVLGPGLVLALLFASHDARYGDALLRHMASFERHHAPLVIAHTAILAGAALGVLAWAVGGDAPALGPAMTRGALHGLAVFAALMTAAAAIGYLRRGPSAAAPWAVAAALLVALWAGRDLAVERVIDAPGAAAARVAIVLEPGYAALRDPQRFLSGITAWRETIAPAAGGQGYFGAQVLDPGVLLSIENDYFPVLLLRETGAAGIVMVALLLLALVTGLWLVAGERFLHGSSPQRTRALAAAALGVLCLYQPLASLGVLPLTGITWPGLGLDSPTDLWILVVVVLWIAIGGDPAAGDDGTAWRHDAELRTTRVFRRVRLASALAAALVAAAGLALVARASSFALERPGPVDDDGRATPAFAGLERAVAYALGLSCPWPTQSGAADALVPMDLLGEPLDGEAQRYHGALRTAWQRERGRAVAEIGAFLAAPAGEACRGRAGRWRFERRSDDGETCLATFAWGWPAVELAVTAPASGGDASARCAVELPGDVLAQLRFPSRRPYRGARVRLVSSAMGAAAADRGELVAGHVTVRLRPGAGELDVSQAQAGLFAAEKVRLSDDLTVEIATDGAALRAHGRAWMFVKRPPRAPVHLLEADAGGWRLVTPPEPATTATPAAPASDSMDLPLERLALLVVGGPEARNLWLFRPPRAWGEESAADPLLADDISTVGGERRRHYIYGGNLPELGWVNPYHGRMSLGLDGWVHVALSEIDRAGPVDATTWTEGPVRHATCGTLSPPTASPTPASPAPSALPPLPIPDPRVCTASPFDGVLECRVTLQPELSIQLRHLTELIALDPTGWATRGTPATRAAFTLLRGDTGAIVAQGDFVPGRASSAYAPATPEIEQHLVRLREDRDPATGAKLPRASRGESSAEKADWNQPVAVGSTLKPVIARAVELAAPDLAASLVLHAGPRADAACRRTGSGKPVHAVLGHCPPTPLLAGDESFDMHGFLARSSNWFMAALGLVATALPDGAAVVDGVEVPLADALDRDVGAWSPDHPLVTRKGDVEIVGSHSLSLPALRQSPVWQTVEALVGRPLCTDGDKAACRRAGDRRDVCAARALPVAAPSADLRHLVALGPDRFDLYGDGSRRGAVPIRDYLQFLRGAGLHPLGSLAQLTDTFGRVVYDPGQVPATGGGPRFGLAASWFPVATAGTVPAWSCASGGAAPTVLGADGGLCGVVRAGGTAAAAMKPVLADPRVTVFAAKTGTIDALADVSENRTACERWNLTHTVAGQPARADRQPYWLPCEEAAEDDSLFLLAFSVAGDKGPVPFTLGLRFERSGKGVAAAAARHYVAAIAAYVSGASKPSPSASPLPASQPPAPAP
jgi:hypothetical protein